MTLKFQIVTPERTVLREELDSLTCPTQMGQITILPNHLPLIASLQPGELIARYGGKSEHIAVSGGFVEVRPGNEVIILADTAEHADEIDIARAEEAKALAEKNMKEAVIRSGEEYAALAAMLQRNIARLKVARRGRSTQHRTVQTGDNVNS